MSWNPKAHIDKKKIAAKRNTADRLEIIKQTGNESDFVALVKAANPNVTPEQLADLIEQFHALRASLH